MSDQMKLLQGYVNDMLAVETELHEAFRRQKRDNTGLRRFTVAHQIVSRTEDTIDRHLSALRDALKRLGSDESTLKKAVGTPGASGTISVTGPVTRKAISRYRPPIIIRICVARWCRR